MLTDISIFLAFGAGALSFVSPCVFPLYPVFLSYITGVSVADIQSGKMRGQRKAIFHTIFFLLGFSIIYLVLGLGTAGSATIIETWYVQYGDLIRQIGAILIVFFGLVTVGVFQLKFLMKDHKLNIQNKPSGYMGTTLIGLAFALGWTPCMGPILAATLGLVGANPSQGLWYMVAYVLGFSIPFFLMAFFITKFTWLKKYSGIFMKIGGSIMIVMGVVLFFDKLSFFNSLLSPIFGDFQGF
ncbi:cytochrome C biogenesis protein CcdA [Virgibacillus profundi]|uniref:Cytochrome C biogenesis protein CcdA n=1 Tax=Virgibacillus profundi TaxID=2024555 RepID=A0A2A2IBP0_9BACI|nr:cytochrome c biogenesis protein CcdA [Virgibacillus profundi]PAV28704.1 cytochrome C biogenesis protein CcdA [Virgibacillus profundi]PXY52872.1 cytochrome C biogenesis protein CcdA [Virgibacillus profundi]